MDSKQEFLILLIINILQIIGILTILTISTVISINLNNVNYGIILLIIVGVSYKFGKTIMSMKDCLIHLSYSRITIFKSDGTKFITESYTQSIDYLLKFINIEALEYDSKNELNLVIGSTSDVSYIWDDKNIKWEINQKVIRKEILKKNNTKIEYV